MFIFETTDFLTLTNLKSRALVAVFSYSAMTVYRTFTIFSTIVLQILATVRNLRAPILADIPTQIHLAIAGLSSESFTVSWVTQQKYEYPIVEYGMSQSNLTLKANTTSSSQYHFNGYTSGYIHHAVLPKKLAPSTTYYCKQQLFLSFNIL